MKWGKVIILSSLTAGMATGCISIGNSGIDALTEEEKNELRQELDEATREIQAELDEAAREMQAELDDAIAEAGLALDEAKAEVQKELGKELGEGAEWIGEMICGEEERPRRVAWKKAAAEDEIDDRDEFVDSLALEDWKASDKSVEGLTEDTTYTVQWKKSVGLLDGWKKEYVDIGSFTVYQDSNLIAARIHVMDGNIRKASELFGENLLRWDLDDWFIIVYEVPEEIADGLRR